MIRFIAFFLIAGAALFGEEIPAGKTENGGTRRSLNFAAASELAVASSLELRSARASLALRQDAWLLGLRAYFPKLSLTASENDRLQEIGADSFIKNYAINLDQLLWDGGRTSLSRRLERMDMNLSRSKIERMALDVADTALSAYRSVLSARESLAIRETALESLVEQRHILARETALGLALPADLAGADLNLANARLEIHSLRLDLAEMEQQFAGILGLDTLPELEEKVDVYRAAVLPGAEAAGALAGERNPDIVEARYSITKKQAELKAASRSWIPAFRLQGSFGLSGREYPLNRYNWSLGLNIEFSSPWFQNTFGFQGGWEPPHDRSAILQNSFTPLPDPAAGLAKRQAMLELGFERERYRLAFEKAGRLAQQAVEKCGIADRRRILALEAAGLASERCRLEELKLKLGRITRLELMESMIEYTQKEIAVVEAAVSLLEAERELERFLDLKPGELMEFAAASKKNFSIPPSKPEESL